MWSDYELAKDLLLRPRMFFSEVESLRDVLALVHGAAVARYPPHGSGWLPGFAEFVRLRFDAPPVAAYITLLKQFGHLTWPDGCNAVLELLEEWKTGEGPDAVLMDFGPEPGQT